jgi:16S rRNA (cytosine967-C5)-methyltransferase
MADMEDRPRLSVVQVLARWRRLDDPPAAPGRADAFWTQMNPRDRALAFDLLQGVIRWRGLLDCVIAANLSRPMAGLDPVVRAILEVGVYQLLLHGGVADYAAVDSSVDLAPAVGLPRAGALVNAVLRGVTRMNVRVEQSSLLSKASFPLDMQRRMVFDRAIFPDPHLNRLGHLAVVTSHPLALVDMLEKTLGAKQGQAILIGNNARPVITLRADTAQPAWPPEAGLIHHESAGFLVAAEGWNDSIDAMVAAGVLSPQDPTAAEAVRVMITALEGRRSMLPSQLKLLDLCAGMGTKTLQMARALPEARVVACDVVPAKLAALQQRMKQAGVSTVQIRGADELIRGTGGSCFDGVLVDVPCSNTGVMARRVQARWRWAALQRDDLAKLQHDLLETGSRLVAAGGVLVYSTCSINPGENERIVARFIASQPAWKSWSIEQQKTILPRVGSNPVQRCDGGFVCVLSWQRREQRGG